MVRGIILTIILLSAVLGINFAQDEQTEGPVKNTLSFEGSIVWQGQSWPTSYSGVGEPPNGIEASPLFIRFGTFFHMPLDTTQSLRFGLDLFTDEYVYKENLSKAFPTQAETGIEAGELAMVLALGPAASWVMDFNLTESTRIGFDLGLQTLVRIALYGLDGCTGYGKITEYLNSNAKFIYTTIGLHSRFHLREGIGFGPWLRTNLPMYRLWDGEDLPFWDTMFIALGFDVQLDLP